MKITALSRFRKRKSPPLDLVNALQAAQPNPMETMTEASARLREAGFRFDLQAESNGQLRCTHCGFVASAEAATVMTTVRFEGDSNPDDEEILLGIMPTCGHAGLFSSAYGPTMDIDASEVLQHLCAQPPIDLVEESPVSNSDFFYTALDTETLDRAMGANVIDLRTSRRSSNHPVYNAIDEDIAQNWAAW